MRSNDTHERRYAVNVYELHYKLGELIRDRKGNHEVWIWDDAPVLDVIVDNWSGVEIVVVRDH